jgi:hypothetical protein
MPKLVFVPKLGHVSFPDDMSDEDIAKHVAPHHAEAVMQSIMAFMRKDRQLSTMTHSAFHREMASVATMLEKYPRMAMALDAGITKDGK